MLARHRAPAGPNRHKNPQRQQRNKRSAKKREPASTRTLHLPDTNMDAAKFRNKYLPSTMGNGQQWWA